MLGIASTQPRQIPPYACDGGGLTARPKVPPYACDGGGLTAKTPTPAELQNATVDFVGKVAGGIKDYVRKPAKNDASEKDLMLARLEDIVSRFEKVIGAAEGDRPEDEDTADFITGYIADLEKTSWMLDAWLMQTEENLPKL